MREKSDAKKAHHRLSHLAQSHRSVKFSHSTVVGGGQREVYYLPDTTESEDENVVSVTSARSPSGTPSHSPKGSKARKYSIETANDLLGFGMSSFL